MKSTKAISPRDIQQERIDSIPDAVIRAINRLLSNNMEHRHGTARLSQSAIAAEIIEELKTDGMFDSCMPTEQMMLERGWFKLKPIFGPAGWNIDVITRESLARRGVVSDSEEAVFFFKAKDFSQE